MGNRNHLHVCQHCGVVHATASSTGPRACVVCDAFTFSEYALNDRLEDRSAVGAEGGSPTDRARQTVGVPSRS
jgi:predicted  nucleic acid-binding Zn-ribbon protein